MKQDIRNMIDAMEKLMNSMQELIYNYYAKHEPVEAKNIRVINIDASNITVEKAKFYEFDDEHWFSVTKEGMGVFITKYSDTSISTASLKNGSYVKVGKKLYIVEDGDLKFLAEA